ncbi:MAG: arsenite efflux transporter metallochaperone ArsD [Acidimicrobiales bacterium]|nr:arsenite efflux transporter metallochaperone ArsD [Acidimicrobiales bacterium]
MKIDVYDPAMCCSTGVCGPSVDPALATFADDLDWLDHQGAEVRRYNLGQEPGEFAANQEIRVLLEQQGEDALPAVFVDGELASSGRFPSRDELAQWIGATAPVVGAPVIAELAAIGAAIGSNCEPCFKYHYAEARKLGLTNADLALAVKTAQAVKTVPADKMLDTASRLLGVEVAAIGGAAPAVAAAEAEDDAGGCCGGEASSETEPVALGATSSGCC